MRQAAGDDLFLAFLRAYTAVGLEQEQITAADFWRFWGGRGWIVGRLSSVILPMTALTLSGIVRSAPRSLA
jgi:hypothetical protein